MCMSFLVAITGVLAGAFGIGMIGMLAGGEVESVVAVLPIEVILIVLFLICLKKYKSPEYQEKRKNAREDYAKLKEGRAEYRERKQEIDRKRTTPVSTRLLGESAAEYKRSVGSMAVRGAVGSILGPGGAMIGMATTKNKNVNKDKRRFLVKYEDGHVEEAEVKIGTALYERYMELLEWDK